jgi:hypothetical protein
VKKADKKKRTIAATHTSLDNFDDETDEDQIINKKYIGAVSPQVSAFAEENDIESCESAIPIQYTVTQRGGLAFDDVYAILEEGAEAIINDGSSENQVMIMMRRRRRRRRRTRTRSITKRMFSSNINGR